MNQAVKNLKPHLIKILDRSISETELSEFVQLCRAIVQSHLDHLRSSLIGLCLRQGLTITDLAYHCIADAFMRDESNRFPRLEDFASSLRDKLNALPELEVFLAFKSFMSRIADAQLARLYAQSDPAGGKIHRNLRDCLKQSKLFSLEKDFRGLVLRPLKEESLDHLEPYPAESLERDFLGRTTGTQSTLELLNILLEILVEQSEYRRSMSLVDAVQLFKKAYRYELEPLAEKNCRPPVDGLSSFEIERMCSQVELALKEKILLTYFARGKIARKEAEAMFNAFHDMLWDWCHSGDSEASVCEYLRRHMSVEDREYEASFRSKMEYLLKIAREEFAARLMREI
jgi:hypothetical protein